MFENPICYLLQDDYILVDLMRVAHIPEIQLATAQQQSYRKDTDFPRTNFFFGSVFTSNDI